MFHSKSILYGLLAISFSLLACQEKSSEVSTTMTEITLNGVSYTQNGIGECRDGSSVFTAQILSQNNGNTYISVYFEEKIQPKVGTSYTPTYITITQNGTTQQGKWINGEAQSSSYQNGRPSLLFNECRFENDICLSGSFIYRQKSKTATEDLFLWEGEHPFKKWLSGEPTWSGNNLSNIQNPQMIIYRPDMQTAPAPAVLICPGGSYVSVATYHEGSLVAEWFKQQGFVAAVLYYTFPAGHPEIPLSDAQQAIRLLRENSFELNINPEQVGVIGFSAGGHLAAFVSTAFKQNIIPVALLEKEADSRPDFSILFYPVITMSNSFVHVGSRNNLLGTSPSEEMKKACSPELLIDSDTPPALLFHALDDNGVDIRNAQSYHDALLAHNVPSQFITLPSGGHGFGFYPDYAYIGQVEEEILNWLYEIPLKK